MAPYHKHEGCDACLDIPAYARKVQIKNEPEVNPLYVVTCRHGKAWFWGVDPDLVKKANDYPETFSCSCDNEDWHICHRCGNKITMKAVPAEDNIYEGEEGHDPDCSLLIP